MKSLVKFSGLCAAVLALVTFILMLATPAITGSNIGGFGNGEVAGTLAIFGNENYTLAWSGLLAWIFVLVAMLALCAVSVLPLLGIKALEKFENLILCVSAGLLLVGAIFMFVVVPAFWGANSSVLNVTGNVGAGWIVGAILDIIAACGAALKPASGLLGKK